LLVRQEQINSSLDLDKGEQQVAEAARDDLVLPNQAPEISAATGVENSSLAISRNGPQGPTENGRGDLAKSAIEYMRHSRMAIADMPITERPGPDTGVVSGTAVAIQGTILAVATAPNRFVILEVDGSGGGVAMGADVRIRVSRGRATVENPARERGR
jgi:hypothetical protein